MKLNISKYKILLIIISLVLICATAFFIIKKYLKKNISLSPNPKLLFSPEESLFRQWKTPYEKEKILSDYDDLKDPTFESLLNEKHLLSFFKCYKLISTIEIDILYDLFNKLDEKAVLDRKKFDWAFQNFTVGLQNTLDGKTFKEKSIFYKVLFSIEIDSKGNVICNYKDLDMRSKLFDKIVEFFGSGKFKFLLNEEKKNLFTRTLRSGSEYFSYMEIASIIWSFTSQKLYLTSFQDNFNEAKIFENNRHNMKAILYK